MIDVPKTLLKSIREGDATTKDLVEHLQSNYTLNEILNGYAELLITAEEYINQPQISITREELNRIVSLFRIKGERLLNGEIREETRGRKRIIKYKED